jgi:hypothetical protein
MVLPTAYFGNYLVIKRKEAISSLFSIFLISKLKNLSNLNLEDHSFQSPFKISGKIIETLFAIFFRGG